MTWWNEAGALWGWAGCLLAMICWLRSGEPVIAALAALLGGKTPQRRQDIEIQRDAPLPGLTAADCVATTNPPQRP